MIEKRRRKKKRTLYKGYSNFLQHTPSCDQPNVQPYPLGDVEDSQCNPREGYYKGTQEVCEKFKH